MVGLGPLSAAVLLEIDISNPSAVVIRSTEAAPSVGFSGISNYRGVTLREMTAVETEASGSITAATLAATDGSDPLTSGGSPPTAAASTSISISPTKSPPPFKSSF